MTTPHISEHLANDRTFLAFLRTAVSLLSLGIAVNRFALYLLERKLVSSDRAGLVSTEQMGVGLVVAGGLLIILALVRFIATENAIDRQEYTPGRTYAFVSTALVVFTCIVGVLFIAR